MSPDGRRMVVGFQPRELIEPLESVGLEMSHHFCRRSVPTRGPPQPNILIVAIEHWSSRTISVHDTGETAVLESEAE